MQNTSALEAAVANQGVFKVLEHYMERIEFLSRYLEQEIVAARQGELVPAIRTFKQLADLWDRFNDLKKAYNANYDRMSITDIPEMMKEAGVKTINVEDVGRVTVSYRFSCSMINKEAGFKWLEDSGHEDIIQRTVNFQTLSAFAKNLIQEEGKDMPEDVFKVGTVPFTSITKVK